MGGAQPLHPLDLFLNYTYSTCTASQVFNQIHMTVVDLFDTHNYDGNLASNVTHNINRGFSFWKKSFKKQMHETKQHSSAKFNSLQHIITHNYSGEEFLHE